MITKKSAAWQDRVHYLALNRPDEYERMMAGLYRNGTLKPKKQYAEGIMRGVLNRAEKYGIPMVFNSQFPRNSLPEGRPNAKPFPLPVVSRSMNRHARDVYMRAREFASRKDITDHEREEAKNLLKSIDNYSTSKDIKGFYGTPTSTTLSPYSNKLLPNGFVFVGHDDIDRVVADINSTGPGTVPHVYATSKLRKGYKWNRPGIGVGASGTFTRHFIEPEPFKFDKYLDTDLGVALAAEHELNEALYGKRVIDNYLKNPKAALDRHNVRLQREYDAKKEHNRKRTKIRPITQREVDRIAHILRDEYGHEEASVLLANMLNPDSGFLLSTLAKNNRIGTEKNTAKVGSHTHRGVLLREQRTRTRVPYQYDRGVSALNTYRFGSGEEPYLYNIARRNFFRKNTHRPDFTSNIHMQPRIRTEEAITPEKAITRAEIRRAEHAIPDYGGEQKRVAMNGRKYRKAGYSRRGMAYRMPFRDKDMYKF